MAPSYQPENDNDNANGDDNNMHTNRQLEVPSKLVEDREYPEHDWTETNNDNGNDVSDNDRSKADEMMEVTKTIGGDDETDAVELATEFLPKSIERLRIEHWWEGGDVRDAR